jgi:hypothetical protein
MDVTHKDIVFPDVPHDGYIDLKLHDHAGNVLFEDRPLTTYEEIWNDRKEEWTEAARQYEDNPGDFCYAWQYLEGHPAFWKFGYGSDHPKRKPLAERLHVRYLEPYYGIHNCLEITVGKVDPELGFANLEQPEKNTATGVAIEMGQRSWPVEYKEDDYSTYDESHCDWRLNCGGPTVELAILRAAHNVWEVYGNDRRICDGPYEKRDYVTVLDPEEFDELVASLDEPEEVNERVRRSVQRLHEIFRDYYSNNRPGIKETSARWVD